MRRTRDLTAAQAVNLARDLGAYVRAGKGGEVVVRSDCLTRPLTVNVRRKETTRAMVMLLNRLTRRRTASQGQAAGPVRPAPARQET